MIKNCRSCKWADWQRTKSGAINPHGYAECKWPVPTVWPASRAYEARHLMRPTSVFDHSRGEMRAPCTTWEALP